MLLNRIYSIVNAIIWSNARITEVTIIPAVVDNAVFESISPDKIPADTNDTSSKLLEIEFMAD